MKRNASAVWQGNLKSGKGRLTTESGVLKETAYSFSTRFEGERGTNPEELIAAAHAGCFTMALSAELEKAGLVATSLRTSATVTLDNVPPAGWTVTAVHLALEGEVPSISQEKFAEIAHAAKANCPISRLLKAAITLDAQLKT